MGGKEITMKGKFRILGLPGGGREEIVWGGGFRGKCGTANWASLSWYYIIWLGFSQGETARRREGWKVEERQKDKGRLVVE